MCGIFGIIHKNNNFLKESFNIKSLIFLAKASQSRGKDSSGLCVYNQVTDVIDVFKGPVPINQLLRDVNVKNSISNGFKNSSQSSYAFGHARLVTNGTQLNTDNNQPVIKNNIIGVHNGIVVNVDELWDKNPMLDRKYEIDTEVVFALIENKITNEGLSIESAVSNTITSINGTIATAFIETQLNKFVLSTNNGSLYTIHKNNKFVIFGSEQFILEKLA